MIAVDAESVTRVIIEGQEICSRWTLLTPELATEYLQHNTSNRNLRPKHVGKLAHDLINGEMVTTHQGVAFDVTGEMVDGQHRCHAVIKTGIPVWVLVTWGLPLNAKARIDMGAVRSSSEFQSGKHKKARAAASRILVGIKNLEGDITVNRLGNSLDSVTNADIQRLMDDPGVGYRMMQLSSKALLSARLVMSVGPAGMLAAAVSNPDFAEPWLDGIIEGAGLSANDPRLALSRYRTAGGGASRTGGPVSAFIALKNMHYFARSKPMSVVRWTRDERLYIPVTW